MTAPPVPTARHSSQRLSGTRIIVTGGARGIGGEIATRFAAEGARVGVLDRLVDLGSAKADEIGGSFFEVDLLDPWRRPRPQLLPSPRSAASMYLSTARASCAYPASKSAIVALTRQAALEWGCHGITANSLCPGYILTDMGAEHRTQTDIDTWTSHSPLGRLGTPTDVASVALFLASADSDYLTGQAINVTGGMDMH